MLFVPAEVLRIIFSYLKQTVWMEFEDEVKNGRVALATRELGRVERWRSVDQVCKHWRAVALGHFSLWKSVHIAQTGALNAHVFVHRPVAARNSQMVEGQGIEDISLRTGALYPYLSRPVAVGLLQAVLASSWHSLRRLDIRGSDIAVHLQSLFCAHPLVGVRELTVDLRSQWSRDAFTSVEICLEDLITATPFVERLSLTNVIIASESLISTPSWTNLVLFEMGFITSISNHPGGRLSWPVVEYLAQIESLVCIKLRDVFPRELPEPLRRIQFGSSFRRLVLSSPLGQPAHMIVLLEHISVRSATINVYLCSAFFLDDTMRRFFIAVKPDGFSSRYISIRVSELEDAITIDMDYSLQLAATSRIVFEVSGLYAFATLCIAALPLNGTTSIKYLDDSHPEDIHERWQILMQGREITRLIVASDTLSELILLTQEHPSCFPLLFTVAIEPDVGISAGLEQEYRDAFVEVVRDRSARGHAIGQIIVPTATKSSLAE